MHISSMTIHRHFRLHFPCINLLLLSSYPILHLNSLEDDYNETRTYTEQFVEDLEDFKWWKNCA